MDLLKLLQATGQTDNIVNALAGQFGLQGGQANDVMGQVLGALGGGVKNVKQQGGLESLMGALQDKNTEQYIEQPQAAMQATDTGNQILGQLFGSKEVSRNVAAQVEQKSGVSSAIIKKMLPVIATMAMGAMTKKVGGGQGLVGTASRGMAMKGIMNLIDQDNDGNPLDDIMKMVGKIAS